MNIDPDRAVKEFINQPKNLLQVFPSLGTSRAPVAYSAPLVPLERRQLVLDCALGILQKEEFDQSPKKTCLQKCVLGEGIEIVFQLSVTLLTLVTMLVQFEEMLSQDKDNCRSPQKLLLLLAFLTVAASVNTLGANVFEFLRAKNKKKQGKFSNQHQERAAILGEIRWHLNQALHLTDPDLRALQLTRCYEAIKRLPEHYLITHPETADLMPLLQELSPSEHFAQLLPSKKQDVEHGMLSRVNLEREYLIIDIGLSVLQTMESHVTPPRSLQNRMAIWEKSKIVLLLIVNALAIASFAVQIQETVSANRLKCQHAPHLLLLLGLDAGLSTVNTVVSTLFVWLRHRVKKSVRNRAKTNKEIAENLGKIRFYLAKGINSLDEKVRQAFLRECKTVIGQLPPELKNSKDAFKELSLLLDELQGSKV